MTVAHFVEFLATRVLCRGDLVRGTELGGTVNALTPPPDRHPATGSPPSPTSGAASLRGALLDQLQYFMDLALQGKYCNQPGLVALLLRPRPQQGHDLNCEQTQLGVGRGEGQP